MNSTLPFWGVCYTFYKSIRYRLIYLSNWNYLNFFNASGFHIQINWPCYFLLYSSYFVCILIFCFALYLPIRNYGFKWRNIPLPIPLNDICSTKCLGISIKKLKPYATGVRAVYSDSGIVLGIILDSSRGHQRSRGTRNNYCPDAINHKVFKIAVDLNLKRNIKYLLYSLDSRTDLPKVRYATALDWFLLMSFFYCIATLLEFAGVHYFTKVYAIDIPSFYNYIGGVSAFQVGSGEIPALVDDEWEDIAETVESCTGDGTLSEHSSPQHCGLATRKRNPLACPVYGVRNSVVFIFWKKKI